MVDFVGAGCGAPDLLTLRGKRLLENADLVIYTGSLINKKLLRFTKPECELLDSAYMTLDEVIDAINKAELLGKNTVRLHTGDPSLYGAVREQFDRLDKLGIKYNICPGVSSMSGAAAALKTEYTLPGVSQTVIITRMAGKTPVPKREKIEALAVHGATMVIFLSAGMIGELTERLMAGGYAPETPAAVVYKASWADEIVIRCPLSELHARAREKGITKTALIVVGGCLGEDHELSKLYDRGFSTGFRKGEP